MTIKLRAKHLSGFWVDAPFSPFTFPAGEAHIKFPETFDYGSYTHFVADIRGHDPQDLFHLAMLSDALDHYGYLNTYSKTSKNGNKYAPLTVFLPYLPGARADRGYPAGAEIYHNFLTNVVDPSQVITLDPHSDMMPGLWADSMVNTLTIFPVERIIRREVQDGSSDQKAQPYQGVIAPDKGAVKRAQAAATVMGVPVYLADKVRDFETGKLSGFQMVDALPDTGKFLIVDDICDGGGTFNGLADAIKETNPSVELDLWVTHGVFSHGFDALEDRFGTIHTTNSFYGTHAYATGSAALSSAIIKVHDITPYMYGEVK